MYVYPGSRLSLSPSRGGYVMWWSPNRVRLVGLLMIGIHDMLPPMVGLGHD